MKKWLAMILLCTVVIVFTGCQKNKEPAENPGAIQESGTTDEDSKSNDQEKNSYDAPEEVLALYEGYNAAIHQHQLEFTLSDIEKSSVEDSNFYTFSLQYDGSEPTSTPRISFQEYKGVMNKSFNVTLPDDCDNAILKNIIVCTIAATNPNMALSDAEEYLHQIVNSYDGINQSEAVALEDYTLYISPKTSTLTDPTLNVIANEEINVEIDTSEYKDYTAEEMQAPLNKGEKAHLSGTIQGDYELGYVNGLEINSGNETYCIYYNPDRFTGCFSVGQECDFYGQIAEARDGYSGCLRLDYFKEINE